MAECGYCHATLWRPGVTVGGLEFCSARCAAQGRRLAAAYQLPASDVAEELTRVQHGRCPRCHGPGPVEVFTAHAVWSVVVTTTWVSSPRLTCRACATKRQLGALAMSVVLGWWSFGGLIRTPIQITRNLKGLRQRIAPDQPSPALEQWVRLQMLDAVTPKPDALDLSTLIDGLGSRELDVRMQAATALGDRGALAVGALPHLQALLNDPDRRVRMRARWAIETIRAKNRR